MDFNAANRDYVLKTVKQRDIHFIRLWFTDIFGQMKSFAITPSELETAFEEGMGFDGGAVAGFSNSSDSDMIAMPDAETFQVLPWRPTNDGVARMFCNILTPDGKPSAGDPRFILRREVRKAADQGYIMNVGPEVEYFYFKENMLKEGARPEPIDQGSYFDLTPLDNATELRRDTILTLEQMGIPVEYSHHEAAPSQQEIDLRYSDALSMADAVMTYKLVVKEIAMKHGYYASFMPKPLQGINGSGMHMHQSLFNMDDENLFYDDSDPLGYCLSDVAKSYIAGVLKYAPEFTLLTNQNVNSYKRLIPGFEAPYCITWAAHDRNALVRIPRYKPGKGVAARFELRSPDPSCNPYLVFAAVLAAGLRGMDEGLKLPDEAPSDVCRMSAAELEANGIAHLPKNLGEAVNEFESSEFMKEVLGEQAHSFITEAKRREWLDYCSQVSPWEFDHYYQIL